MSVKGKGLVLVCGLLVLMLGTAVAQDTTFKVVNALGQDAIWGAPGKEMKVYLKGNGSGLDENGIAGINFTIKYDSTMLTNPVVTAGDLASGFTKADNVPADGELRVVIYPAAPPIPTFKAEEGTIAEITFTVAATVTPCTDTSPITVDVSAPEKFGVSNKLGVSITDQGYDTNIQNATFKATHRGDLTFDGHVNAFDFLELSNKWKAPGGYNALDFLDLSNSWKNGCLD